MRSYTVHKPIEHHRQYGWKGEEVLLTLCAKPFILIFIHVCKLLNTSGYAESQEVINKIDKVTKISSAMCPLTYICINCFRSFDKSPGHSIIFLHYFHGEDSKFFHQLSKMLLQLGCFVYLWDVVSARSTFLRLLYQYSSNDILFWKFQPACCNCRILSLLALGNWNSAFSTLIYLICEVVFGNIHI